MKQGIVKRLTSNLNLFIRVVPQRRQAMTHKTIATLSLISMLFVISVCMAQVQPSVSTARETDRDGRFIAYDNGTVLDTRTNLMWAVLDNGSDINWRDAQEYCENYRGGGYTDWRMPTQDELAGLYDKAKTYKSECGYDVHLTALIRLTCSTLWASKTRGSGAARFRFGPGPRLWTPQSFGRGDRALPVRSGK